MKKFNLLLSIAFVAIFSFACSQENPIIDDIMPEDGIVTLTREIAPATKSSPEITLTATFDLENEALIGYSVSPEFYAQTGLTVEDLDELLKKEMGSAYYLQDEPQTKADDGGPRLTDHAACIEWCNQNYTVEGVKEKGRGKCKGNCWVDTVKDVLVAIGEAIVDIF